MILHNKNSGLRALTIPDFFHQDTRLGQWGGLVELLHSLIDTWITFCAGKQWWWWGKNWTKRTNCNILTLWCPITSAPFESFKLGDLNWYRCDKSCSALTMKQWSFYVGITIATTQVGIHTLTPTYLHIVVTWCWWEGRGITPCNIIISFLMGSFCMTMVATKSMISKAQCYPGGVRWQRGGRQDRH